MKNTACLIAVFFLSIISIGQLHAQNEIQRVRIDFETPLGYVRHLLLGFTPDPHVFCVIDSAGIHDNLFELGGRSPATSRVMV